MIVRRLIHAMGYRLRVHSLSCNLELDFPRLRKIIFINVRAMTRSPGQIPPSVKGLAGRLLLRVIVKEDARTYHVVTVYKTTKVAKYWRQP